MSCVNEVLVMSKHVIIFVPTEVEKRYLKDALQTLEHVLNFTYKVVVTGYGKVNASQFCALETQNPCSAVVSCGFCGASSRFNIGDVVNPSKVMDFSLHEVSAVFPDLMDAYPPCEIPTVSLNSGITMVSNDSWVGPAEYEYRASVLPYSDDMVFDMESFAIAQVALDLSIPTIVLKVVADIVERDDNKKEYTSAKEFLVNFDPVVYHLVDIIKTLNN